MILKMTLYENIGSFFVAIKQYLMRRGSAVFD